MKRKKIIILDDNKQILKLMETALDNQIFETFTFNDVSGIIKKIREILPDVILLDIKMSGITGADVIKIIKEDKKINKIPVIAFTSYAMIGDKDKFLNMGFNGYISKPIDTRMVNEQIIQYVKK